MAASQPPKKNPFAEIGSGKIKLKKAKKINDKSGPKLSGFVTKEKIAEYDKYIKSFDIESWYETLKDITFPTEYVAISYDDGQTLYGLCEQVIKLKKALVIAQTDEEKAEISEKVQNLDVSKLSDLAKQIDCVIDEWRPSDDQKEEPKAADFGVFAKLSSRSAKDATDAEERLQSLFKQYCEASGAKEDNDRVRELLTAATHCMKVGSAQQILSMFINSERIHHDLGSALKYGKGAFAQNVVLRKWIPIDIDMEFRGFVCNGTLTALSQYNHFIFFERLAEMKKDLAERIQTFFDQKVKERLTDYEGYIVDFAVCGKDLETILIIELNPFMESTDAGLFSWKTEKQLLQKGPFEFRIRTELPKEKIKIEMKYRVLLGWE